MVDSSFLQQLIKIPENISKLRFDEIHNILTEAKDIFIEENLFLEFKIGKEEEVYIIGDIHGNLTSLLKLVEIINKESPKLVIFLGDIVDRGPNQIECLLFVLALKILNPDVYYILRGNHETLEMNQTYGFIEEFARKFENESQKFIEILEVYDVIPICAIINKILCLHGGIPEDIHILKKLRGLKPRDIDNSLSKSLGYRIFQMMWNDPKEEITGFIDSFRGTGIKSFGKDVFEEFMKENDLTYLIRAHECFPEGYRWFFNNRLLSIFSSENYRGEYYPNPASYAIIKNNSIFAKILEIISY